MYGPQGWTATVGLTAVVWTATVGFDSRGLDRDCRFDSRGLGRDCRLDSRGRDRDCLFCLELFGKGENVYFEQESSAALLCD